MEENKEVVNKKKCTHCKVNLPFNEQHFKLKRNGDFQKQCIKCCNLKNKSKIKHKCEHGRQQPQCIECGGSQICEHSRRLSQCIECGGSQICEHSRRLSHCMECGGSQICEHRQERHRCKQCNHPIPITIKNMIRDSKASDKKYNRYDQTNFINYCFVENLIDDCNNKCYYCECQLQYKDYNGELATIERLDNSIGHIKGNCVIACRSCNLSRVGDRK